jgi:Tol biopolymer transport system component
LDQITGDNANDTDPVWSPDGRWIAFASDRQGRYEIFIAAVDDGGVIATGQPGYPSDWATGD